MPISASSTLEPKTDKEASSLQDPYDLAANPLFALGAARVVFEQGRVIACASKHPKDIEEGLHTHPEPNQ